MKFSSDARCPDAMWSAATATPSARTPELSQGFTLYTHHAEDRYDLLAFARDDFPRFLSLVDLLSPRDAEIMLCFACLQKRPTDLSVLFGKAGHRAEEDLHKAAHKLAGLVEFGDLPDVDVIQRILEQCDQGNFGNHRLGPCIWQYARCRDFGEMRRLVGPGLRTHMYRVFKILHASPGREEGLLAGWILWLIADADEFGKGWRKLRRDTREHKLGPTEFHCCGDRLGQLKAARKATRRGGRRQLARTLRVQRKLKFLLRGAGQ